MSFSIVQVFFAIALPLALIWLLGVRYAFGKLAGQSSDGKPEPLTGEAVIPGEAEDVSRKLAERLVSSPIGMQMVRITSRTSERVEFEKVRGMGVYPAYDRGVLTLEPHDGVHGPEVRVRYRVSMERFFRGYGWVLRLVCFGYGALFVIGVPVAIWLFVIPSSVPAVRTQVFQTFQMVHGVWPPFLLGFLAGKLRRVTQASLDTLLENAKHLG
jgi:hypothetical protein